MATWKEKYNKKYDYPKSESHSLSDISKETGISKKGIQQIYNKGIGAYKTNPQSVRPNVTSKEQWAMARVYSSVMGGKASKVDAKELKMQMGGKTEYKKLPKILYHASRDLSEFGGQESSVNKILKNGFKFSGDTKSLTPFSASFFDDKYDAEKFANYDSKNIVAYIPPNDLKILDLDIDDNLMKLYDSSVENGVEYQSLKNLKSFGNYDGIKEELVGQGMEYRIYNPNKLGKENFIPISDTFIGGRFEKLVMSKGGSTDDFNRTDYYKGYYERLSPSNFVVEKENEKITINMNDRYKSGGRIFPQAVMHDGIDEVDAIANGIFAKGGETDFNPDGKIKDKIVHASGDAGGMLVGKRHSNGGIKALNKSTGQPLEMEGGEVVITRDAVSDNKKRSFNGKMMTNRQILSAINESGGGVSFADGGQVPNDVQFDCNAEYEYGGKTMCGKDLAYALGGVTTAIVTDPNEAMADLQSTYGFGDVYAKGGTIECGSCDWSWDRKDGGDDMYVCHKCGTDNTSKYDDSKSFDKAREELGKEYLENLDKFAEGGQLNRDEFPNYIIDPNEDDTLVEGLSKIKDLGGSTGATLYEYKGKQYVVKAGASVGQSYDEFLANQIYYLLDVPVPRSTFIDGRNVVKEFIGKEEDVDYDNSIQVKLILRGFVADALLGNWDIYKNDNIIIKEGTRTPFRIDSGGSLRYRARGEEKENFGTEVFELQTLKDNNPKLKPYVTDDVIKKGIEKVIKEKENILDLFKDDGSFRIKMEGRINYLERVLNEINDRRGTDFVDEDVEVKDAKTTKLSKLKKGDKFYFPLGGADKEIGRTNPLDTIYVFDDKIKSTYHYSSEGSKFSTSTNRDVVLLIKPSLKKDLEVKVVEAKEPSFEEKFLLDKISELRKRYEIKKRYLSEIQKGIALRDIRKYEIALDEIRLNNTSFENLLENFINSTTVEFGDINEKRTLRKEKSINGEKSQLTKREYDAVRSESFINWFGDWELANETGNYEGVSKIINSETKEPLVVYHGTDTKFISWETYAKNNLHYFAKKKRFADFFATSWQERTDDAGVGSATIKSDNPIKGTFVYSCFLDIKNPIDFTPFGIDKVPFNDYLKYLEIKYDLDLSKIEGYNDLKDRTEKVYSWIVIRKWQQFNLFIKNNTPYDGFSFYEFIPDSERRGFEDASLSFTAFNSNQIKFTNNTSFSKFTDDSRLEIGGIIF